MNISYKGSVLTPAGFRSVTFSARVDQISTKRVRVVEVTEIDGEQVNRSMNRTGANRQKYCGTSAATREEGKIKNLSACTVID